MKLENENCKECGKILNTKEDTYGLLKICTYSSCSNFWENKGSEIIIMLK